MGKLRYARCFLGMLVFLGPVFLLGARDISITILDGDLGIPLEGAELRSFDGNSYRGDEEGKLTLSVPEDRPVVVRATYPGYAPGRLVIEPGKDEFTLELFLSGALEARELVLEESALGESGGRAGRSVALAEEEIRRTGEIGVIEDVMTSIKLLPGVGYSGLFNALPSIRGGQPGDLMAAMDGFYIENPYHWGGGFSIFDPKMVQRAELSHGVFSTRYGHTISGLLDITVKKPSPQEMEYELGLSTNVANAGFSFPIGGRGGVMLMGRLTYYDPVVWAFQGISRASDAALLKPVEAISTAPYIRSTALNANYRFTDSLEMGFTGFFGADGAAADYKDDGNSPWTRGYSDVQIAGSWVNYQGFGLAALTFNPRNDMVLKA
ncbi:MAG: TonB-dependent receptor plug domain-containing protein, partial [Treponema sp.]|nr:TonB-dependent receptor plug domain-containing protein [Treponema sp.]